MFTCYVSFVTYLIFFLFFYKAAKLVGFGSAITRAYPVKFLTFQVGQWTLGRATIAIITPWRRRMLLYSLLKVFPRIIIVCFFFIIMLPQLPSLKTRCGRGCSINTFVINSSFSSIHETLREFSTPPRVTCHVSGIRCQVSHVTFFFNKVLELVAGGSVINGAYPHKPYMTDFTQSGE